MNKNLNDIASAAKLAKQVFRAFVHPLRLRILNFIGEHPGTNVTTIYQMLHLEQSVASLHLSILRSCGLVTTTRNGKQVHYSVNNDALETLLLTSQRINRNLLRQKQAQPA